MKNLRFVSIIIFSAILLMLIKSCKKTEDVGIVGVDRLYILRNASMLLVSEESLPWWWPLHQEKKLSFTLLPTQMIIDSCWPEPLAIELKASRQGQVWPDALYVEEEGKIKHASLACIIDEESFLTCIIIDGKLSVSCLDKIRIGSFSANTKKQFTKGIHVFIE